ncbi:MAG: hypothetical protein JXA30_00810 [Deltaproteobacteria bacterium]|nr:hypothetical protein [Deltaproteobacteria bacterium]
MGKKSCTLLLLLLVIEVIGCSSNSDNQDASLDDTNAAGSSGAGGTTSTIAETGDIAESNGESGSGVSPIDAAADGSQKEAGTVSTDGSQRLDASNIKDATSVDTGVTQEDSATPADEAAVVSTCDRTCLIGYISEYLDALVARDPSRLKLSPTLKYTLNGVVAEIGEGLWQTASQLETDKRLDFADPLEGQVATQTVVDENGISPVIYQVRLKVVGGEITEIEAMEVRQLGAANGFFIVENMKPQPVFLQEIEPSQRMNRDELRAVMELYMDYLEGKKTGAELPFDTNCVRYENGVPTANGVAAFEMQSFWRFQVTRRYLVFDEQAGIVWGMFPFSQAATSLVVGEAFKIIEGKFMMIQAVMAYMPAKAWD